MRDYAALFAIYVDEMSRKQFMAFLMLGMRRAHGFRTVRITGFTDRWNKNAS